MTPTSARCPSTCAVPASASTHLVYLSGEVGVGAGVTSAAPKLEGAGGYRRRDRPHAVHPPRLASCATAVQAGLLGDRDRRPRHRPGRWLLQLSRVGVAGGVPRGRQTRPPLNLPAIVGRHLGRGLAPVPSTCSTPGSSCSAATCDRCSRFRTRGRRTLELAVHALSRLRASRSYW